MRRRVLALVACAAALGCGGETTAPVAPGFLGGTATNHEIGLVVSSLAKTFTMFQLGSPGTRREIPLGASSAVTPVGFSVRGRRAAVPLGNTASVALVDLENATIQRFFTFPSGNTTGSVFSDDTTLFMANATTGRLGRVTVGQAGDAITTTVGVAPAPNAVSFAAGRVLVTSANLDANFAPIGNGIVTVVDPRTMQVIGTVSSGGTNSSDAAIGPDGLLYVVNTGDFVGSGSLTIINPATLQATATIPNIGVGPGAISIDDNGLAYISGFAIGTVVWNTKTRTFVRGVDNSVCAKLANGGCRGAFAAATNGAGDVYQLFFGSAAQNLAPYVFVYKNGSFALSDSVAIGAGPAAIAIRTF